MTMNFEDNLLIFRPRPGPRHHLRRGLGSRLGWRVRLGLCQRAAPRLGHARGELETDQYFWNENIVNLGGMTLVGSANIVLPFFNCMGFQ